MGEDEPWHLEYAHHVAAGHMPWGGVEVSFDDLPEYSPSQAFVLRELGGLDAPTIRATQLEIVDSMRAEHFWERVDWASWSGGVENFDQVEPYFTATHQPPLYYLLIAPFLAALGGGELIGELLVGRGISLFAYLAVVAAAWAVGRRVCDDPLIALVGAFVTAWWPMHARQAAVLNNDVLVKVASAWTLVLALDLARLGLGWGRVIGALGLAGLALALKTTAAGVLAPLGLALVWQSRRAPALRGKGPRLAAAGALLLLVAAVFLAYRSSHNPAIPDTVENLLRRMRAAVDPAFLRELGRTTVGAFNWYSRELPGWLQGAVGGGAALCAAGLAWSLVRPPGDLRRAFVLLCLSGCAFQLVLVFLRGTAAGRYAFPLLPAFALCAVVGALGPFGPRGRRVAAALLALGLVLYDGYFAWAGLVWNQYGVWGS